MKQSCLNGIGSAEEKSSEIIDEAVKAAEAKKKEALLEAKEENLKARNELEKETKERRAEIQRYAFISFFLSPAFQLLDELRSIVLHILFHGFQKIFFRLFDSQTGDPLQHFKLPLFDLFRLSQFAFCLFNLVLHICFGIWKMN